jgi:hypothetical protein
MNSYWDTGWQQWTTVYGPTRITLKDRMNTVEEQLKQARVARDAAVKVCAELEAKVAASAVVKQDVINLRKWADELEANPEKYRRIDYNTGYNGYNRKDDKQYASPCCWVSEFK